EPFEVAADAPIVAAARRALGQEAPVTGGIGWADSAIFSAAGIPTVIFGLGLVDPLAVRVTRAPHLLDAVSRRLWDATDIVSELTAHYDALSVDIQAE